MKKISIIAAGLLSLCANAHALHLGTVEIPANIVKTFYPVSGLDTRFFYQLSCNLNADADNVIIYITPLINRSDSSYLLSDYPEFKLNDLYYLGNSTQTTLKKGNNIIVSNFFRPNLFLGFEIYDLDSVNSITFSCYADFKNQTFNKG